MNAISGKICWVVGASSGIGFELVKQLLHNKNFVIASARSVEGLQQLQQQTDKLCVVPIDVTDVEACAKGRDALAQVTDHLDYFIYCAGTCEYDDGAQLRETLYQRVMQTNFMGAVNSVRVALPFLKKARTSRIVALSSLAALIPFPRAEAYGASKVALEYFMRSLAIDLDDTNIDVCIVRPGFVDTPLTQKNDFYMPFIVGANRAAEVILSGLAKKRRTIDFPWPMQFTIKLMAKFPRLWERKFATSFRKSHSL